MDIDKYINENLDEIIEFCSNENNLNDSIDILMNNIREEEEEEYKENYEENHENNNEDGDKIEDYYLNLLNIFLKYYNDKYNKHDNFFSGINDKTKDTSSQMELFFEIIVEYKQLKKILNKNSDSEIIKFYFDNSEKEEFNNFLDNYDGQIYKLEIKDSIIYSPSLLICLNFILDNFNYLETEWIIFNLRNL
jgi:hypothetical protein